MNYLITTIAIIFGVLSGRYFWQKRNLISEQGKRKAENKKKVLQLFKQKGKVVNDDVEKLLGVSNATAERYLDELEKEGKLIQHGNTGKSVFYTLSNTSTC